MVLVADESRLERKCGIKSIWYPKGKQPEIRADFKTEAWSFYGALNVKIGEETVYDAPRQKSFHTVCFLRKLERQYQGKKVLLLWDGSPSHRGKVKEYLRERDKKWRLRIEYFPTYSPELNPQEKVWKKAKQAVDRNKDKI